MDKSNSNLDLRKHTKRAHKDARGRTNIKHAGQLLHNSESAFDRGFKVLISNRYWLIENRHQVNDF